MACLPRTGVFFCHTLDCPFSDKGIQAYGLELVHRASGQSAVRRHARASILYVIVIVVVADFHEMASMPSSLASHIFATS